MWPGGTPHVVVRCGSLSLIHLLAFFFFLTLAIFLYPEILCTKDGTQPEASQWGESAPGDQRKQPSRRQSKSKRSSTSWGAVLADHKFYNLWKFVSHFSSTPWCCWDCMCTPSPPPPITHTHTPSPQKNPETWKTHSPVWNDLLVRPPSPSQMQSELLLATSPTT